MSSWVASAAGAFLSPAAAAAAEPHRSLARFQPRGRADRARRGLHQRPVPVAGDGAGGGGGGRGRGMPGGGQDVPGPAAGGLQDYGLKVGQEILLQIHVGEFLESKCSGFLSIWRYLQIETFLAADPNMWCRKVGQALTGEKRFC